MASEQKSLKTQVFAKKTVFATENSMLPADLSKFKFVEMIAIKKDTDEFQLGLMKGK